MLQHHSSGLTGFPDARTRAHPSSASFRIASAIPGRIRLQLTRSRRGRDPLTELCARVSALPDVEGIRIARDARSVIVCYARSRHAPDETGAAIAAVAAEFLDGRLPPGRGQLGDALLEEREARASASFSAVPEYAPRHNGLPVMGKSALRTSARMTATATTKGGRPLLFSLLAVGLAAVEAVPAIVTGAVLALSALPLVRRAIRAVRYQRMSADCLDLANLVILAVIGDVLSAGQVSLILNLSDYWRSRKLRHIRQKLVEVMLLEYLGRDAEALQVVRLIEHASVSNAYVENQIARIGDSLVTPLLGAAAGAFLITGDALRVTAILKFSDLASDVRISAPATVISAMTAGAHHGFLLHSARAMEKLAAADTVVFDEATADIGTETGSGREAAFTVAVKMLLARGIERIVLPSGPAARIARGITTGREGISEAVLEVTEETRGDILQGLREQGRRLIILEDGLERTPPFTHIDVGVVVKRVEFHAMPAGSARADVFLLDGDLRSLPRALDSAREIMRILELNKTLVAVPTGLSLFASAVGLSTPLINALINHGAAALAGLNAIRPLLHVRAPSSPSDRRRGVHFPPRRPALPASKSD